MNIASSNPKHVRRDTPPDQKVNHNSVSLSPALQLTNFNDDMLYQLCHYLPLHETNVLARSCKRLDQVIDKGFLSSEGQSWFVRFGPVQQNQFRAKDRTPINLSTSKWMSFFRPFSVTRGPAGLTGNTRFIYGRTTSRKSRHIG